MQIFKPKILVVVTVSCWLMILHILSFPHGHQKKPPELTPYKKQFKKKLLRKEKAVQCFFNDTTFQRQITENRPVLKHFQKFYGDTFNGFVYKNDSLVFWSGNQAIPANISQYRGGSQFVPLSNGYYELIKKQEGNYTFVGLILLQTDFSLQNKYLTRQLSPYFQLPAWLEVDRPETEKGLMITNLNGRDLCKLKANKEKFVQQIERYYWWGSLYLIGLLVVFLIIHLIGSLFARWWNAWLGLLFIILASGLVRMSMLFYQEPAIIYHLPLFDPQYYASSFVMSSLGDMLINVLLLGWWALYINIYTNNLKRAATSICPGFLQNNRILSTLLGGIAFIVLFAVGCIITHFFTSLILDSNISYQLQEFYSLNIYSLFGLIAMGIILLGFFFLSRFVFNWLYDQLQSKLYSFYAIIIGVLLFLLFYGLLQLPYSFEFWVSVAWCFLLLTVYMIAPFRHYNLTRVIFTTLVFALLPTVVLSYTNYMEERAKRKAIAHKLADEPDPIAEYLLQDVQLRIKYDPLVQSYFKNLLIPTTSVKERIIRLHFGGYFKNFDFHIQTYVPPGEFKQLSDTTTFKSISEKTITIQLVSEGIWRYFVKKGYQSGYIVQVRIPIDDNVYGRLRIVMTQRLLHQRNVYPELLLEEEVKPVVPADKYAYAIYKNKRLVIKEGDYPYSLIASYIIGEDDSYRFYEEDGYSHLLYTITPRKQVIVTKKIREGAFFSVFSILFCFFLLFVLLLTCIRFLSRLMIGPRRNQLWQWSFSQQVQGAVVFVVVVSFLILAYTTVQNVRQEFNNYHHGRILRKLRSITSDTELEVKRKLAQEDSLEMSKTDIFAQVIPKITNTHSMDVNIYDLDGQLLTSSQPDVFERGLISTKINPTALYEMKQALKSHYIHDENIGRLNFLAAYVPIRNQRGNVVAILNLPYYADNKDLQKDMVAIFTNLFNVYTLAFVIAGVIALTLGRFITNQLLRISSRIRGIDLGADNEPIQWEKEDEIGQLVQAYNAMLKKLKESAEKLAKSERESAWQRMARQVAHEIKNPLTPMKLSVQRLQRAYKSDVGDKEELTEKVTKTLLDQIDTLSRIASEFSAFAKMPEPEREVIDIKAVLAKVVDLYEGHDSVNINFNPSSFKYNVYADRNQLKRVFTNLLQNAIQAIPADKDGKIRIVISKEKKQVTVEISDNGAGIPKEKQDKIFEPNFTTKGSGMGLGLAMTKNIIEASEGKIWFETEENKGTTFYVCLPIAKP